MKQNLIKALVLYLKGVAMGAADVVPGVSGGTIAFISGIYGVLLDSIKSFTLNNLKLLFQGKFRQFWTAVNGTFLLVLFAGIATSILSLAKLIKLGLDGYPVFIWSFFLGLIIASAIVVAQQISWKLKYLISLVVGIVVAAVITNLVPGTTPEGLWFVFISGAVAICAMILPGISGSFILLLMGKYTYILTALNDRKFDVIFTFMAGAATGIVSFSHVLSWLLKNYKNHTIAVLCGFMLGSLGVVWPWKLPIYKLGETGHEVFTPSGNPILLGYKHFLPEIIGVPEMIAFGLILLGLVTIFAIERLAARAQQAE